MKLTRSSFLVTLALLMATTFSSDPDSLQDPCVADLSSGVTVNGFTCKEASKVNVSDFSSNILAKPGSTNNTHGSVVTGANVQKVPGLNTLGVSLSRIDDAPGGLNPPHTHPRATEVVFMLEGELYVGFITTANVLISKTISKGEIFVFPKGLVHFQKNNGNVPAAVLSAFNNQLPGTQSIAITLFAALPSEQQMRAFAPASSGFRKVILATNIAETSITIPGIKYVIDPGLVKARSYDPGKGMESLIVVPTSKSQALQRSGRAGREGPGKCFRLYPENEFEKLEDSTMPEIKRFNLANVILQLKALGVDDILGFDFIEKLSRTAIVKSLEQLFLLGALTDDCQLSDPVGRQMARLPLDPIYSKALILASEYNCLEEMLITVAMLSVESIFYTPRDKYEEVRMATKCFASPEGDHITLINVYRAAIDLLEKRTMGTNKAKSEKVLRKWCKENFINSRSLRHARDIHRQIKGHAQQMGLKLASCGDDMLQFRRCLVASFFLNAAVKQPDGTYRALASGEVVQIHPSSVLFRKKPECIIFNELIQTTNKYVRNLTRVDHLWLTELAPQFYAMQN